MRSRLQLFAVFRLRLGGRVDFDVDIVHFLD
jgi:hypothetical protein